MILLNLIPHGNLTPDQGFIFFIGMCLFGLMGYGIYLTFGAGKKDLRDAIDNIQHGDVDVHNHAF